MSASWHNRRIEAIALMRESLRRAEAAQDFRNIVAAALNLADALVGTDPRGAIEVARTAVALASGRRSRWNRCTSCVKIFFKYPYASRNP